MKHSKQRHWISTILAVIVLFPLMTVADNRPVESSEMIERILWKKMPIAVTLIVGQERLVHFPDSVSVGIPQSLTLILRSQSINGTLYLTAREPFEANRVIVRSEQGEPIYILDISAKEADPESTRLLPNARGIVRMPVMQQSFELIVGGQVEAIPVAA